MIVIDRLETAVPLARALVKGGLRALEITLRTPVALEAIKAIIEEVPEAVVGAGTVVTPQDLRAVEEAGVAFAISPGITLELLEAADRGTIPLIPDIASISDIMTGMSRGYDHFKFFPAEAAGGTAFLQSVSGPFPQVRFCPTGGIHADNYRKYMELENVLCVGGSWVTPQKAIADHDWPKITALGQDALCF